MAYDYNAAKIAKQVVSMKAHIAHVRSQGGDVSDEEARCMYLEQKLAQATVVSSGVF